MAITVVIADDHPVYRHGLRSVLEKAGLQVVGEACDGRNALKVIEQTRPDVILLDISMPRLSGLEAAEEILNGSPRSIIILLTVHREEQYVRQAFQAGVRGYVLKCDATSTLVEAINEVHRGGAFLSPGLSRAATDSVLAKGGVAGEILSPRELQVLQLLAEGNTAKEVAQRLILSFKTVDSYRTSLMNKLEIHDITGLVRYAVRRGVVKP